MAKKKRRKAVYMDYYMSLDEISEELGISKMQVRWALKRALFKLKRKFKKIYGIH